MNKLRTFTLIFFLLLIAVNSYAQFGKIPPFKLELVPLNAPKLPGLHSFSFAQSGSKWLFIGGRINGLHGMSSNESFEPPHANNNIVVIDTATWKVYSVKLNTLPLEVADPLRSTNMQYYHQGDYLYMLGGYGFDSTQFDFVTYPVLSAIHVNHMIDAVINGSNVAPHIRQLKDTIPMVCGGELNKLGDYYYLAFGQVFGGRYSDPPTPLFFQYYTNRIKRFKIVDDGTTLKITDFSYWKDTVNFHRRDLNVLPIIKPDGNSALSAYGGVFKYTKNLPYQEPITITDNGTEVHSNYQQMMSHYTCATIPIFDSVTKNMYTTFLGGISLYDYDELLNKLNYDSLIPFINDITTFTRYADGKMEETILPVHLKGLLGSNAVFIAKPYIPRYSNGVIKLQDLPKTKTLIGYMFGGIKASKPNTGPSTSNDTIYRVYLTPEINIGVEKLTLLNDELQAYPNPASGSTTLSFRLNKADDISLQIYDATGRLITIIANEKRNAGNHTINWNATNYEPGIYFAVYTCSDYSGSIKITLQ